KRFEVFGTLSKNETVFTIDHKIIPGTLVFEALRPFPGYYYDTPLSAKPVYLYLALQEQYTLVDLIRASQQVQAQFSAPFDAGKGFLELFDEKYNVLRVRHLRDYDLLEKLQQAFSANGIHFMHKSKKIKNEAVKIRIIKFFSLEEIDENIFLDTREKYHAYIRIPRFMNWPEFDDVTNRVKYNWVESNFDAAKASFYYDGKLHEVVRIYSNKIGPAYLKELQKLYVDKIK
ncbi:MAG TPA: hypothetical protein VFG54_04720, partial [Prolixibacteraceae bacterium]|nr:hypothetical protein [Prolixibacteraceae bacterium]